MHSLFFKNCQTKQTSVKFVKILSLKSVFSKNAFENINAENICQKTMKPMPISSLKNKS